ncbi:MAG: tyrosine--tRNA ligase [Planctomycetes bacterium]|nr:tyrosine--tRNA ligase [Planctomycetota bacterium]
MIHDAHLATRLAPLARTVDTVTPEADLARKLAAFDAGKRGPLRVKFGIDPTSTSVHVGNGIPLWNLRRFQDAGHQAVLIIGDYTALVGDPSGKDKTRPMLTPAQVQANVTTWLEQIGRILDLRRTEVRHNSEWFSRMPFVEVLQLANRMTVQQMLERDSFQKRFGEGSPISIREFLYCLMQGWDSVMVRADVELGGTDQTFNLNVGRRLMEQEGMEPQVCVVSPLVEGTDGTAKMSKSLGNAIGLADAPDAKFGAAMRISDALLPKYLRLLTDLTDEAVEALLAPGAHPRDAKLAMAEAVVRRYDGPAAAPAARERWIHQISEGRAPDEMPEVALAPSVPAPGRPALPAGHWSAVDLVVACKFAPSRSEARRLVEQGGVTLDDARLSDVHAPVAVRDGAVLKVGNRRYARLRVR